MVANRRVVLIYALMPFVLVMLVVASSLSPGWQEAVLAATTGGLVLLISQVALPKGADQAWGDFKGLVSRHRTVAGTSIGVVVVGLLFLFEANFREKVPGHSWAGSAVQISLFLWPISLLLYQARRFVTRAWRGISWLLAIFTAVAVVAPPIVIFEQIEGTVPLWLALLLLAFAPVACSLLFGFLRADMIQRASQTAGLPVSERSARADSQARERPRGGLAVASALCAIVSAILLLGSAVRVPIERRLLEASQVAERGAILPALKLQDPVYLTARDRLTLIERFSPVLRLHEDESWAASDAAAVISALDPAPSESCSGSERHPCSEAALEQVLDDLAGDARPPRKTRVFLGGVVYPRLVDVRREVRELGDELDDDATSLTSRTRWLAQYWLFYPNNDWKAKSAIGKLSQIHAGDWEWIAVGIDEAGSPVFVAYSAHCAGSWRPWTETASVAISTGRRVLVGGAPKFPASHPLAIVARGSHANYATPGAREPDWGSCEVGPFVAKAMRWLTFAAAAREETPELGTFQVPAVLTEEATERVGKRPLWWGDSGLTLLGRVELGSDDHGPPSPGYQGAWKRPIETIFAGGWECDAGRACGN